MEESEKRRERLKAMRIEAAETRGNTDSHSSGPELGGLSNPLIESESSSTTSLQHTSPRFDFYTDPMAAFSRSKRRNNVSPQIPQGHYNIPQIGPLYQGMLPPPPIYQNTHGNAPGQRIFQEPGPHFSQGPQPHFIQGPPPHFNHGREPTINQGLRPNPNQGPRSNFNQGPGPTFNQSHVESPMGAGRPPQGNPPNSWGGSSSAFNYNNPPNFPRGGNNFTSPGFRQGDSPHFNYGRGRGQDYNSSSYYDPGIGRGRSVGSSNSGQSGGRRGAGSRDSVSAEQRPDLYYRKEMVEDPWKSLTPVIWKGVNALDSEKSWLPKSIGMKKAKVSPETAATSISQQSLAEYLAASFNDSTDDAVDDQPD